MKYFRGFLTSAMLASLVITGCSTTESPGNQPFHDLLNEKTIENTSDVEDKENEAPSDSSLPDDVLEDNSGDTEDIEDEKPSLAEQFRNEVQEVDGRMLIMNPENILSVVNKNQGLPADYLPASLVIPNVPFPFTEELPKKQLRLEAARALEHMYQEALTENIALMAVSGYRSYDRQKDIYENKVKQVGEEAANQVVAYPGESEHQTGLAIDVSSETYGYRLDQGFGETEAGQWVASHAHEFGFIIRYPKGKEAITGYQYEPWHLRFVGVEAATEIFEQNVTLEEYMELVNKY